MDDSNARSKPSVSRSIHLPPPRVDIGKRPSHITENATGGVTGSPAISSQGITESQGVTAAFLASLERLSTEPQDVFQLAQQAIQLVCGLNKVAAAGYLVVGQGGQLRVAAHNWSGFAFERDEFQQSLKSLCRKVSLSKKRDIFSTQDNRNLVTWCIPIGSGDAPADVLTVSIVTAPQPVTLNDHQPVEHLVGSLRIWHANRLAKVHDNELKGLAALVELVGMIEQSATVSEACHSVVNELQKFLGCHRIAIGLSSVASGGATLRALSGLATFDSFSDTARLHQAACDETVRRETVAAWPPLNPNSEHSIIALQNLAEQQNLEAVVGVPLTRRQAIAGVLLVTGRKQDILEEKTLNLLRTAGPMLGRTLFRSVRMEGNWLTRAWRRIGMSRWSTRITIGGMTALATALLCLPAPYRIKVDATLEPLNRRIVSAPYDGLLESTQTKSGAVVQKGDLLARMDAREIRWELSSITAERSQAAKEFDSELAAENIARAQLAKMESERLRRKQELLQHRELNHELTSPIEGMVLNGSVEKLNGAPVRMGQPLFEIAELNPLKLEMAVPAEDYFHIQEGQAVSVTFDGFDGESFDGTILRIRPRSEVRDDRNVFIAEMEIPNPEFRLRPGIQGRATITGEVHSVAWNTFHKAWEALWRTDPTTVLTRTDSSRNNNSTVAQSDEPMPELPRRETERTKIASGENQQIQ